MKLVIGVISLILATTSIFIFDFTSESDLTNWFVVDDVVMGGRSEGRFFLNQDGHAVFTGQISLQNNGGFSSVRYGFEPLSVKAYNSCVIRVRGDGKSYQFRVKSNQYDRASYVRYFQTSGNWQTIEIPFAQMYPTFRGMKLDQPNFPGIVMEEIAFLIGNKNAETFKLEIDFIQLK